MSANGNSDATLNGVASAAAAHAFAADADDLRRAVRTLIGDDAAAEGASDAIVMRLPSVEGRPLASDRLAGLVETDEFDARPTLESFEAPALTFDPLAAFRLLLALGGDEPVTGDLEHGPDLRYLSRIAAFIGDLLVDQRFIPTLYQFPDSALHAGWAPWLEDRDAAARVEALLASMPPVIRAAADDADTLPWAILNDAILSMTDAVVRSVLVEREFADAIEGRDLRNDRNVALLSGLLGPADTVASANGQAAEFFTGVRSWIARLSESDIPQPFRLRMRLEEPETDDPNAAEWRLTFHLQSTTTGRLVNAIDLWDDEGLGLSLNGTAEEIQEFVLHEIARAARIWERIGEALEGARPQAISLSTAEAYELLRSIAPVLSEAGLRVLTPEWWGKPTGRLGLRLILEPQDGRRDGESSGGGAPGRAGLRTLVRYRWQVSVGERPLTMEEFRAIAESRAPLVRVGGQWLEVKPQDLNAAAEVLDREPSGEMTIQEAMQSAYGLRPRTAALPVVGVESSGWIAELLDGRAGARLEMLDQPPGFQGSLRPYQRAGLSWLAFLDEFGLGACLADDMGLGKTIQLIALLLHERERAADPHALGPTLIVAPMSVIENWSRELERFSPNLDVHVHHGLDRPIGDAFIARVRSADVVLTTYGLVNRDIETLQRVVWRRVVLDEAQYVKNTPTKQAQAIRQLQTQRRVALTGTPVENRLSELWSIMDFLNPDYLGQSAEFRRRFSLPIERHRDRRQGEALRALIRPFILRRLKTDPDVVPDLPELVSTKEYATLTPEQARLYEHVVGQMLDAVDSTTGMQRRGLVLAGIVKLKQICNHPANLADGAVPGAILESGDGVALSHRSGKVRCLLERLEEVVAAGDQALIFTQYRRMGQLLTRIIHHDLDIPVQFMHGGTPRPKRQEMIDNFQNEDIYTPVFVLSLRAGGVGLNLTGANHVFHFDRWWNPAVENQATDRAFRIGQNRTVHVHKLVCTGTLEEHIDEMIEQKTELAEQIVGSGDAWITELSTTQLRELLTFRGGTMEVEQ